MAWTPKQPDYRGFHGLFKALRRIVERDAEEALAWGEAALDIPLPMFGRIDWATRHSKKFPYLVVEPTSGAFPRGEFTIEHSAIFDVSVYLSGENTSDLKVTLIAYFTVLQLLFLSASRQDWVQEFTPGKAAAQDIELGTLSFDQVDLSDEEGDRYIMSASTTLTINLSEVMP